MGQKNKIKLYANESPLINDAIDRIVVEIHNKKSDDMTSQSVLLTGCSPQCGTTSTCISLGIAFATSQWKTLIIDCDIRKANKFKKLNQKAEVGLEDYLVGKKNNDEDMTVSDIVYETNVENLSYIPCGKYAENSTRMFCSPKMSDVFKYAKENFDYIIFDCPSITVVPDSQILFKKVDGIVLLSALRGVTKKQIKEAKLKIKPYQDKYYGMIVNKVELPLYKKYIKNFDYYFLNKYGEQKLDNNANKKYNRLAQEGGRDI
ncbi:capsular exopolysaccharide family [Acetitomaculum ruminis DSM 5522]|uniref:non-specific protein-tyrosine kinase n=1 Tax=Acetitomaculum ruminis DSM 5522 TaxID=1120918 RepID=A0A1I0YZZ0_9FIRM|nr:CpsD/CapB family tyrosine-protein kinase [Acetitomaculum ruminis]SFB18945.1 capsular exopolysaccharide family [Acetitomaculum ruminis DSM 5522]